MQGGRLAAAVWSSSARATLALDFSMMIVQSFAMILSLKIVVAVVFGFVILSLL